MSQASRRVLIVGCGYVGIQLGRQLSAAGHHVSGLRRGVTDADALRHAGISPLTGDLTRPESLDALPGGFDWVVNAVSSSRGGLDDYRAVYRDGMRNLIAWLSRQPPEAFVHTSSTSVYGQTTGGWVDESSPTEPGTEAGRLLLETEQLVLDAARDGVVPGRVLRAAGIYGPGRGHLFQQLLKGEARLQGDGSRWINMIHRDDVAGALAAVLLRGAAGQIYNVVDNEPVSQREFLSWLASRLDLPLPAVASDADAGRRKRGLTHKRVSNAGLRRETGWEPKHPTFREGYASELAAARAS